MKLQQVTITNPNETLNSQNNKNNKNNVHFGSAIDGTLTSALNFLQTNQAIGATFVDVTSMGTPRTIVDSKRGPAAGLETARREFSSSINDTCLGFYGAGAAIVLAKLLGTNRKYGEGIRADKLFISNDSLDILSQNWKDVVEVSGKDVSGDKLIENYLRKTYSEALAYKPKSVDAKIEENLVNIDSKIVDKVVAESLNEIKTSKNVKVEKDAFNRIKNVILEATGVEDRYYIKNAKVVDSKNKIKNCTLTLDELIKNTNKMAKMFKNSNVAKTFDKVSKGSESAFIKGVKNLTKKTSILGIGASLLVGLSIQPLNTYLTKKKTGQSGFVGGGGEDKSKKFKLLKVAVGIAAFAATLKTIGKRGEIFEKIQFKSMLPTLDQFKFLYGATIVSRILSSRNDNELRETTFKDSLGYANWLIFGGIVSKLTAKAFQHFTKNQYIKYNKNQDGKGLLNFIQNSATMSRNEVLIPAMKKLGLNTIGQDNKALSVRQMIKALKIEANKGTPVAIEALKKTRNLGIIQFAGYLYSGIVLGVCVPKMNIAMTKHFENKKKQKEALTAKA